ncbi:hypothetical protein [Oceanobacillus bengalensis]|uniref:Uncharacterized protein n=1 Tax=Oceanobacillus bengalensis TaxID=1435466 RepID=A0A494Z3R9_9BACI|nr:hypothetical protein [Oceanobacillus bengalensis]RKQ17175.1 hypothetical protein D8M05_05795 [Oceanobacillus bengalensis]
MIFFFLLLALVLFLIITKTNFFKKVNSNNKFMTQLGMAILVGTITIHTIFTSDGETAFKYLVIGMGIMSFIAILIEMIIQRGKKHHDCS